MEENILFVNFGFNKQILNAIEESGYKQPTEIQQKAIPQILSGHDVIGIAQTGTGKTAAYVLPILMKIKYAQGTDPRALIIVPTRELALQVEENLLKYGKYTDLRFAALYGGLGPKTQKEILSRGVDILISTPGRLLELYAEGHIVLKKLQVMVLDEADRLMDMGFIRQLHKILEIVPRKRQNLLFSATFSPLVKKIAEDFLEFPMLIEVEPERKTAKGIRQTLYSVPNFGSKWNLLKFFLDKTDKFRKVIIFCRTKEIANRLTTKISDRYGENSVKVLHGNKAQSTRINSIKLFKEEDLRLLVATDVAARGIDVTEVSHVINFDVPIVYEDYIHRIGRTGRAFQKGESLTFFTKSEKYHIKKIEKLIGKELVVKQVPQDVFIEETPYEEAQEMAREIDRQKRKENPEYQGAFHEKKHAAKPPGNKPSKRR